MNIYLLESQNKFGWKRLLEVIWFKHPSKQDQLQGYIRLVTQRCIFLVTAEAVEVDSVLSECIGALHRTKSSEALNVLYLQPQG